MVRYGVLGRSSFYEIVRTVTSSDFKLLQAVDYVTGRLVHSPISSLQDMVDKFATGSKRKELTTQIEVMRNFLKVQYAEHIVRDNDDVSTHGLSYALD